MGNEASDFRFHVGPVQLSMHRLQTESWVGDWEQDYSFSAQCELESFLPVWSQLRRDLQAIFFCYGGMPSTCSYYVHGYVTRNLRSLPQREQLLKFCFLRIAEHMKFTNGLRSDLRAFNLTSSPGGALVRYVNFGHTTLKWLAMRVALVSYNEVEVSTWYTQPRLYNRGLQAIFL